MTNKEKQEWLEVKYPLTIISDRYDGTYSGASWLAFPLYCDEVPSAVDGYDEECAAFWKSYLEPVGKGSSAQSAIDDLIKQMYEFKPKESEDERIRKFLVRIVNLCPEGSINIIGEVKKADVLAYLEKQKESLHIPETCKENADSFTDKDERIRKALLEVVSDIDGGWPFEKYGITKKEAIAYLEKQKEQKPVMIQWTGKNLKEVIDFTGKSPRFDEWFKSWEEFENYVHSHDDILKLFCEDGSHYEVPMGAWIVKTPDGYNIPSRFRFIQKPAEWSEEDEKNLELVIDCVYEFYPDPVMKYKLKDWLTQRLKSLRPQPRKEQDIEKYPEDKSFEAEWKEYYNNSLVSRSPMNKREVAKHFYWFAKKNAWKPSEEQMYYLKWFATNVFGDGVVERAASSVLYSLYEDLKKLI